eukprot:g56.t1
MRRSRGVVSARKSRAQRVEERMRRTKKLKTQQEEKWIKTRSGLRAKREISEAEERVFLKMFQILDDDAGGTVGIDELASALDELNLHVGHAALQHKLMTIYGTLELTFEQFVEFIHDEENDDSSHSPSIWDNSFEQAQKAKKGSESVDAGEQLLGWMKDMDRMQCSADAGRLRGEVASIDKPPSGFKGSDVLTVFCEGYEAWYLWLRQTYTMPIREKIAIRGKSSQAMRRISLNFAENTVAVQLRLIDASMRRLFSAYASADEGNEAWMEEDDYRQLCKALERNWLNQMESLPSFGNLLEELDKVGNRAVSRGTLHKWLRKMQTLNTKAKAEYAEVQGERAVRFLTLSSTFIAAAVKVSEQIFEEMIAKTKVDALLSHSEPGSSPRLRHVAFGIGSLGFSIDTRQPS